jgi:glycine/D-amino acid oxidase-like deaminating enzyme
MREFSGRTVSIWHSTAHVPDFPPLRAAARAEVAIVGAGIAGLSAAYQLALRGVRAVVLDDGPIGGGDTGRTTAQLTCILDKGYAETERLRGADGARLAAESHMAAIDTIERAAAAEAIDCDFARMDGYLFLAPGDEVATLREEAEAARRAGLDVELLPGGVALGASRARGTSTPSSTSPASPAPWSAWAAPSTAAPTWPGLWAASPAPSRPTAASPSPPTGC